MGWQWIEEAERVVLFANVVNLVAENKTLSLVAVHASHQSLILVNVSPNGAKRIRTSGHLTIGVAAHVAGHVHDHARTDLWPARHLERDRLQHEKQQEADGADFEGHDDKFLSEE